MVYNSMLVYCIGQGSCDCVRHPWSISVELCGSQRIYTCNGLSR